MPWKCLNLREKSWQRYKQRSSRIPYTPLSPSFLIQWLPIVAFFTLLFFNFRLFLDLHFPLIPQKPLPPFPLNSIFPQVFPILTPLSFQFSQYFPSDFFFIFLPNSPSNFPLFPPISSPISKVIPNNHLFSPYSPPNFPLFSLQAMYEGILVDIHFAPFFLNRILRRWPDFYFLFPSSNSPNFPHPPNLKA